MADTKKMIDVGSFEIDRATLSNFEGTKKIEIGNLIAEIAMSESIYSAFVSVDLLIYDTFALTDEFPIVGEEFITFTYRDYFDKLNTLELHVYKVDKVAPDNKMESQSYYLRCITKEFVVSETNRIQQSFKGTVSQMVDTVFQTYFTGNQIDIEETDGQRTFVIPSFTPVETIEFFNRKAFSTSNPSSNFIFFRNREKFYFKTYEKIFKDNENIPDRNTFYYGEKKLGVDDRTVLMNDALSLIPKNRFDLIGEARAGAMLTEVIQIDPSTRSFTPVVYDHHESFGSYRHTDKNAKNYHSEPFKNKFFNKETNVVNTFLTFEPSNQDQLYYSQIIPKRNSYSFYMRKNLMEMNIYGCNDLFAGSVINLVIPEMKFVNGEKSIHPNLSGRYLIESIYHTMVDKQWKMTLNIIKDSFIDG